MLESACVSDMLPLAPQERIAELEENMEQLMTDLDSSMQDVVSRDEEIDRLVAKLAGGQVSISLLHLTDYADSACSTNSRAQYSVLWTVLT